MKINRERSIAEPVFAGVTIGMVFRYNTSYYMAVKRDIDCKYNAVNLESGVMRNFNPDEKVQYCRNAVLNFED